MGGVVTYEDVTSVDSVGIVTARSGLKIGPTAGVGATIFADGSINASGIVTSTNVSVANSITAGTYYGDGSGLTGVSLHALEEIAGHVMGQLVPMTIWNIYFSKCFCRDHYNTSFLILLV